MMVLSASRPATLKYTFAARDDISDINILGGVVESGPILGGGITEMFVGKMTSSKVIIQMDSCTGKSSNLLQNLGCSE